ncbi:MAG: hypothetical protein ACOWW1_07405 [archaeon]
MLQDEENFELESRVGKRFFKLIKTAEIYGEDGDIQRTAKVLGITPKTVEKRLDRLAKQFWNSKKYLEEISKYEYLLFQKATAHSKIITHLSELGKNMGYKNWIAVNERKYIINDDKKIKTLNDMSDFYRRPKLIGINRPKWGFIRNIDFMWIKNQKICYSFEVENTTNFTKAFDRCSNIPSEHFTRKVIVIPEKRKNNFLQCITSNLLSTEIKKGNWYLLNFQSVINFRKRNKIEIQDFGELLKKLST